MTGTANALILQQRGGGHAPALVEATSCWCTGSCSICSAVALRFTVYTTSHPQIRTLAAYVLAYRTFFNAEFLNLRPKVSPYYLNV
eukprot:8629020-Pyramimonas_sp.AAC.1